MGQFAVVQDVYVWDDWSSAAQVLAEVLGLHPTMANQRARKTRGILAENVDRATADRLQRLCALRNLDSHIFPQEDVPPLPKPLRTHEIWLTDDALLFRQSHVGAMTPWRWDNVVLVSAYQVLKGESFHRWATGGPRLGVSERTINVEKYSKDYVEHILDVFGATAAGPPVHLRLGSRELNWHEGPAVALPGQKTAAEPTVAPPRRFLGKDPTNPRLVHDRRFGEFQALALRVLTNALRAYVPPEALAVLDRPLPADCTPYCPSDSDDFNGYNRWLLHKLRVGGALHATLPSRDPPS